jgi:hypothetical protein
VSANLPALAIIVGAAVLAAWVDSRFPRLSPASFTAAGLHMIASVFAIDLGMKALGSAPHETVPVMAALFGAALPATMYLILSAFWLLKLLHGLVTRTVR